MCCKSSLLKILIIVIYSILVPYNTFATTRVPKMVYVCVGRELYLASSDLMISQVAQEISDQFFISHSIHVLSFFDESCHKVKTELNEGIYANIEDKYLVGANEKFYWIDGNATLQDIILGKIHPLKQKTAYSNDQILKFNSLINRQRFIYGLLGHKYNQDRKKELYKQFDIAD